MVKNHRLNIRVTKDVKERLVKKAHGLDMTLTQFITMLAFSDMDVLTTFKKNIGMFIGEVN